MKDATTHSCAQAFLATWISRFGIPAHLSSDRGPQFTSAIWTSLYLSLGIRLHHPTAFHSQGNGLVERFHRHLPSALVARLSDPDWVVELPWVLLLLKRISTVLRPSLSMEPLFLSHAIFRLPQHLLHHLLIFHFFLGFDG